MVDKTPSAGNLFIPNFRPVPDKKASNDHFEEGLSAEDKNDWAVSLYEYGLAVTFDPTNRKAACNHASLLLELERPVEALTCMARLRVCSKYEDQAMLSIVGYAMYDMENYEGALVSFQRALMFDYNNEELLEQVKACQEKIEENRE